MKADVHIRSVLKNERTILEKAYCTQPFKIANITEDKKDKMLRLMLMSSSPGILDGDEYDMKIELERGSSLQVMTQSFQRLFTMKQGASQKLEVKMGEGSSFYYLPHPSVPHNLSIFSASNNIYLSDKCTLVWGEVLTCGRKGSGEAFLFSRFHTITKIFINDKLIIKENLVIEPSTMNVHSLGKMEGFTHQAGLIFLDELAAVAEISEMVSVYLAAQPGILYGITTPPVNGLMVRLLGQKAEQLHDCLKAIAQIVTVQKSKEAAYAD